MCRSTWPRTHAHPLLPDRCSTCDIAGMGRLSSFRPLSQKDMMNCLAPDIRHTNNQTPLMEASGRLSSQRPPLFPPAMSLKSCALWHPRSHPSEAKLYYPIASTAAGWVLILDILTLRRTMATPDASKPLRMDRV